MRTLLRSFFFLVLFGSAAYALGQGQRGIKSEHLPNFDNRTFHFGFLLGYNNSDFFLYQKTRAPFIDSLNALGHDRQPGFNLGIIASLNMTKNFSLRFLPGLSFQDRLLNYEFRQADGTVAFFRKQVESTYLEFPLALKMRSDRINNFAVYAITGAKLSIDMASQKDVNNLLDQEIVVKLDKMDYSIDVGAGVDMFLPYFKFGIELKMGIGIPNVLVDDGTRFSTPLEKLRTKTWVLTFTFEG